MTVRARVPPTSSKPGERETGEVPYYLPLGSVTFAHDLRNILSSVRGYAQLLLSMLNDERAIEYLAIIEFESSKCCDLIERMLGPTSPLAEERISGSDAAHIAERVCELARGEGTLKGIELVCEAESGIPPAAVPDEDLERVLLNLLRNAIQATPRGGRVNVRVRTCRLDGPVGLRRAQSSRSTTLSGQRGVEIEVSDSGRGIPERAFEMIFEPFFSTLGPGEGLGLGLSISSALVERYGGSIDVKSSEGNGTTFVARLPAERAGPPDGPTSTTWALGDPPD